MLGKEACPSDTATGSDEDETPARVMIVEDEAITAMATGAMLKRPGT